jgi:hypothetical protein
MFEFSQAPVRCRILRLESEFSFDLDLILIVCQVFI